MSDLPNLNTVENNDFNNGLEELAELKLEIMLSTLSGTADSQTPPSDLAKRADEIANEVLKLFYQENE